MPNSCRKGADGERDYRAATLRPVCLLPEDKEADRAGLAGRV